MLRHSAIRGLRVLLCAICLAAPGGAALASHAAAPLSDLNSYVRQIMTDWKVPGLAVAVVKDGKLVLARGYGVRELGKPGKVDTNTLFTIASNSKAFTVAALGTLVQQDKLQWDDPVTRYLKGFELNDPWVTRNLTLRDLLTHRTGYCDPIFMWFTTGFSREQIIQHLRYDKPSYGFRAHFCYNNAMYLVASQLIPAITGQRWGQYLKAHLFVPLDMLNTDTSVAALNADPDAAYPHALVDDHVEVIRRYDTDTMAPVGGINSSVNDMSHWLMMLLDDGSYAGKTVLQPKIIAAMETPQMIISADSGMGTWLHAMNPGSLFYSYGLGFVVEDYYGRKLVMHDGDIDGMASAVGMLPELHLGVVVLTNMDHDDARNALLFHILDEYLGRPPRDTNGALLALAAQQENAEKAEQQKLLASKSALPAPLPLAQYTGTYSNPLDGKVRITLENGHLVMRLGNPDFTGDLTHWNHDTFHVRLRYRFYDQAFDQYLTFELDASGKPMELRFYGLPARFERVPPAPSGSH
ncbi:MAG: serine hydrolase [Gammaproteobacteria bacterium]|nr:serine hydrolase [Gammaproteobacteria bacterium]MDE2345895.1 serine hydrolase [Gammaproteobacteria bacterium]